MYYFCDTKTLIQINEEAIANPYCSRALDERVYDELDPDGMHVVDTECIMARFGNGNFQRAEILLKLKNSDEPVRGNTIDFTSAQLKELIEYTPEIDRFMDTIQYCSGCDRKEPFANDDYMCIKCRAKSHL